MKAGRRFLVAAVVLALLMTGPFWLTAAILAAELGPVETAMLRDVLLPRLPLGALVTAIGFAIGLHVLRLLFRQYVQGLSSMAELLRLMHSANRSFRVRVVGPPEVRQLAEAANELARQRDELLDDVEQRIAQAKNAAEEERNRLAALVAELPQAVIVCSLDGRIILYNNRARLQARALAPDAHAAGAVIGLGRSIHAVFDPALIEHALEDLQHRLEREGSQPLAHFTTTTRGGQLIRVQMAPVVAATDDDEHRSIGGYVLTLENISRLLDAAGHDGGGVVARLGLEDMLAVDLVAAARRRIEARVGIDAEQADVDPGLWVKVDSFSLTQAAVFLAAKVVESTGLRRVHLAANASASGERAVDFEMVWAGAPFAEGSVSAWRDQPLSLAGEIGRATLGEVLARHGGCLECGGAEASGTAWLRVSIPVAAPQEAEHAPLLRVESRPEFYDFDLFHRSGESHALDDRRLADLAYTCFDTETTGLEPSAGDEIIQIGAVRIVNNRVLRHESIDQLIDPKRRLKAESIKIHGITEEMVSGQPTIDVVLPQFHRFAEDTVLVAHNAAFDMRFLQMKEASTGVRFVQPVLDTLLLSAVVHPNQESHKLEAIAERLGIPVIGRHNALGDAIVTAEVFLRLAALLEAMGIGTLRQAREAAEKTYYARIKY